MSTWLINGNDDDDKDDNNNDNNKIFLNQHHLYLALHRGDPEGISSTFGIRKLDSLSYRRRC